MTRQTGIAAKTLAKLAAGPESIRNAMRNITPDEVNWAPPTKWTPKQVAVHLLDTELIYGVRARKILSEENGDLPETLHRLG